MSVRAIAGETVPLVVIFGPSFGSLAASVRRTFKDTTGATVLGPITGTGVVETITGNYIVSETLVAPLGAGFIGAVTWDIVGVPAAAPTSEDIQVIAPNGIAGGTSLVTITTEAPAASLQAGTYVTILSGNTVITSGVTNGNGQFVVGLPDGNYTVKALKPGVATFPDTPFTVASANISFTLTGTSIVIPPPASPLVVTIFGDINDLTLGLMDINSVILKFHIAKPPQTSSDRIITLGTFEFSVANGNIDPNSGHFQIDVARGVLVRAESSQLGLSQVFTAPNQPTANLEDLIRVGLPDSPGLLPPV